MRCEQGMRKLRVLSVVHYPIFGGPHNRNARVAGYLARNHGVKSVVVVPDGPGNAYGRLSELGVDVVAVPLRRLRKTLNPVPNARLLAQFANDVAKLRSLIRETGADVVLVNGTANPHAAMAARAEGVAIVWQLLDTFPPPLALGVAMKFISRTADVIMTNGMTVAAAHPGALEFEGPLISFGPCIPTDRFTRRPGVAAGARAELGLDSSDLVIGTVNNINPMKGHHTFVEAAARLRAVRPARFVALGSGGDAAYIDSVLKHAQRVGLVPGKDFILRDGGDRVHELAQAFDIFWMTSEPRAEGMSNSLAEAQCLEIPVVVTRSGGVHESFLDGESGYLVAPHDVDGLVDKTVRLASDVALMKRMGELGAANVRARFTVERASELHLEAYEAAVARRGAASAV